jgi:hypothetical protein
LKTLAFKQDSSDEDSEKGRKLRLTRLGTIREELKLFKEKLSLENGLNVAVEEESEAEGTLRKLSKLFLKVWRSDSGFLKNFYRQF